MDSKKEKQRLLISRFPLESAWGGEEEIHLHMAQVFRDSGKETLLLSSCPHFKRGFREHSFHVFSEIQKDITSKKALFWSILTLPFFFLRGLFWLFYFRFFKKTKQVLFLTFVEKIAWTPLAKLYGMEVFWGNHAPFGDWLWKNPYWFLWKWYSRFVHIIVASEFMKQELLSQVPKAKITVLSNTLSREKDFSSVQGKSRFRKHVYELLYEKTGMRLLQENAFLVGTACRLSREKGVFDVLRVAQKFVSEKENILFLIAGDGPLRKDLEKEILQNNLKNTVFSLGFLEGKDYKNFLLGIDLFLLPSHEEPFGMVLLEAMSAGKAIVASNTGGIPEVVGRAYEGLYKTGNISEMKRAISSFIHGNKICISEGNRLKKRFQNLYSPQIFAEKSVDILNH